MATTFSISNGDTVVSAINGRPKLLGNVINGTDTTESKRKAVQDIRRCLSINRIRNGTGAGLSELIGSLDGVALGSVTVLIKSRIRSMFDSIVRQQKKRLNVRPLSERFSNISLLDVIPSASDRTSYIFRLDTKTVAGRTIIQSGNIG